jgi:hypothetical protein
MTSALTQAEQDKNAITAALQELGLNQSGGGDLYGRAKVNGTTLDLDGHVMTGNDEASTLYARFTDIPLEYQGMWITPEDAVILERPNASETYCKSYYHKPEEGGKTAQDGTNCETCQVKPYIKRDESPLAGGKKCSWRADMLFRWVNRLGEEQDSRDWTLSLPTTSVIELKGTSKKPTEGYVNELNFMQRAARFGIEVAFKDDDMKVAIAKMGAAMKGGRLIASIKVVTQASGPRNFPVIVMEPVNVILDESGPAPEQVAAEATAAAEDFGDLPF